MVGWKATKWGPTSAGCGCPLSCFALFPIWLWVVDIATSFPGSNTYSVWERFHLPQSTIIIQRNVAFKIIEHGKILVFNSYHKKKKGQFFRPPPPHDFRVCDPLGTIIAVTFINSIPFSVYWSNLKFCFVTFSFCGLVSHSEGVFFLHLFLKSPRMDIAKIFLLR